MEKLRLSGLPEGAVNLNLEGRRLTGPLQGFGQLWQKNYRVRLTGAEVSPREVIKAWKENYAVFWPPGNRFYAPLTGIAPGEVGVIQAAQGPMRLSTGVMVLYADEESFTFVTPQGHPFAGWVTFSAFEDEGSTVAQVRLLVRPNDPIYELAFLLMLNKEEDKIWQHTLRSLAAYFNVQGEVETEVVCLDRKRQWSQAGGIWHNAGIRTMLYTAGAPFRLAARPFRRRG
ncbi:MAG: hypothetical protein M3N51_09095 [Actinomycetota bacterium]|nr:hypothetical protein [Actinomycetota bacterium]